MRCFRSFLPAVAALVACGALLADVGLATAKEPPRTSRVYPVPNSDIAKRLQVKLFDAGCYGNQLSRDIELDGGNFRIKSRKALWVFIDTVNAHIAGAKKFAGDALTPQAIEAAFSLGAISGTPQFCRKYGAEFLNQYFTDRSQHLDGAFVRSGRKGTCSTTQVSYDYLKDKGGDYARMVDTLSNALRNFNTVFAGSVNFKDGWESETAADFDKHSLPVVDKAAARKALQQAADKWRQLSFSFGLKTAACKLCYKINDWIYLSNIAQSNGGHLARTVPAPDGQGLAYYRTPVRLITEKMLDEVLPLIKLHRGVTANLNLQLHYLTDPNGVPDGMNELEINARAGELEGVRQKALLDIIKKLQAATDDQKKHDENNPLMVKLVSETNCIGFDGRSVDQDSGMPAQ
ncbi:MAG: hypothetical protein ACR2PI_01265 [Hyphomicrobiaceae bacterium]